LALHKLDRTWQTTGDHGQINANDLVYFLLPHQLEDPTCLWVS